MNLFKNKKNETDQPLSRVEKRLDMHLSMAVQEIFDDIALESSRPEKMEFFDNVFKKFATKERAVVQANNRPIIGYFCMSVPEEFIYAAGALPVRLCSGSVDAGEIGESYFPEVSCPMVKSAVGFASTKVWDIYSKCDLVIIPATCDWKIKLAEILKKFVPVMLLDIPRDKYALNAREFWFNEMVVVKKKLEEITGNKITKKKLISSINLIHTAQVEFRRLHSLRKSNVHAISGRDVGAVVNAYFYLDATTWTAATKELNDELEQRIKNKESVTPPTAPRILLTGSPFVFPNWKIPSLIESSGGALVCDELCTSQRFMHDMVSVDEKNMYDLIMALADRYLQPCTCPVFVSSEDRINKLKTLIDDYKVEGVIYHVLKGCHPYDIELRAVEEMLSKRGISQLKIETDYNPEDKEQLRTRIEAFLETLRGRRYNK